MQPGQRFPPGTLRKPLPLGGMGERVDGRFDPAPIPAGVRGQRCIFTHMGEAMPEDRRLEDRVSVSFAHGLADHARQRLDETVFQRRGRRCATVCRPARQFDDDGERRRRTDIGIPQARRLDAGQAITARGPAQYPIQQGMPRFPPRLVRQCLSLFRHGGRRPADEIFLSVRKTISHLRRSPSYS